MAKLGMHRRMTTVDDVRERCRVDPVTRCWNWLGATNSNGQPRIWAFDHARGECVTLTGQRAVWNIAHQAAPLPGWMIIRSCMNQSCLNPVHLREIRTKAEVGAHMRLTRCLVGRNYDQRVINARRATAAAGFVPTPPHIVLKIRNAPPEVQIKVIAREFGVSKTTVSRIRRGESHRGVA